MCAYTDNVGIDVTYIYSVSQIFYFRLTTERYLQSFISNDSNFYVLETNDLTTFHRNGTPALLDIRQ